MRRLKTILLILLLFAAGSLFFWVFLQRHHQNEGGVLFSTADCLMQGAECPEMVSASEKIPQLEAGQMTVVLSPGVHVNVNGLPADYVMDQRVEDLGEGNVRRLSLISIGGEYPYTRIEELLNYDAVQNRYVVTSQMLIVADHFLVTLREGRTEADLEAFNKKFSARILKKTVFPNRYMVQLPEPTLDGVPDALSVYKQQTNLVKKTNADAVQFALATIPNDQYWSSQWDKQRIGCPSAWDWETGSTNIIVAVIDTGIDLDHPDLAAHIWHNPGEAGALATNDIDDDDDGYVDDWIGWDWGTGDGSIGSGDNNPDDNGDGNTNAPDVGHGTHCAGIIGAIGNNSNQIAGVCWNVTIMALKAAQYFVTNGITNMVMYSNRAESAMKYAADHGAKVVSFSYGGPGSGDSFYETGINYLNSNDVLFVAAAGDGGTNNDAVAYEPAGVDLPNVIAVASSAPSDGLASDSNYGLTTVDLAAPGQGITSTFSGGSFQQQSGTSMAAPQVAGAIALLYSYNPDLPYLTCKQLILDGVDISGTYSNKCVSGGRLNVATSLNLLDAAFPDMDADKLPNKWEITYFGGTTNADAGATASNRVNTVLDAYIADISPIDPNAFFKVNTFKPSAISNGGFVVEWSSVTGRVYSVNWTTNLLSSSFESLVTNIVWPQNSYTDTVHGLGAEGFYRVGVKLQE